MTLLSTLYGRLRLEDCLSPGVQDQPAHYKENLLKKESREGNEERGKREKEKGKGWNLRTFLALPQVAICSAPRSLHETISDPKQLLLFSAPPPLLSSWLH